MEHKIKNQSNIGWWFIILSVLLAFFVKLVSQYYLILKEDALLQVTFDLATTVLISVGITLFIYNKFDKFSREESAKSVYNSVFKNFLNEDIYLIIKRDFFEQPIVRKEMKISFSICETETGYKVIREIIFKSFNSSINKEAREEIIIPDNFKEIDFQLKSRIPNKTNWEQFNVSENETTFINSKNDNYIPIKIEKGNSREISIRTTKLYKNFDVTESIFADKCTIGFTIQVTKPANCEFIVLPTFEGTNEENQLDDTDKSFFNTSAVLIGQGIVIKFFKSDTIQ